VPFRNRFDYLKFNSFSRLRYIRAMVTVNQIVRGEFDENTPPQGRPSGRQQAGSCSPERLATALETKKFLPVIQRVLVEWRLSRH
jgi:hypothetical protein